MKRVICLFKGHQDIPVSEIGLAPKAGGILPSLDGYVVYEPDPEGDYQACTRCGRVKVAD